MKICIISEPQGGGVEKVNMTLAQGLMNRGNDVSIISVTGAITEMGSSFNVPIIYLQKASKKNGHVLRYYEQLSS
ncbi:hypothetical protein [Lacticaseibacillus manihotivorans]|uniref:hypothetical protein n=1 Tax=Lacticaseibacillus manihotivorans TaxID=88233 RepID=UPI0006D2BB5B|nr:hypothetical protein [Lacticaseibacillus manihotivorans]